MKTSTSILTLLLVLVLSFNSQAQLVHYSKQYSNEDGMAERSIIRIIRDDLGKIWLFSRNTVQVFDGANFRKVELLYPYNYEDEIAIDKIGGEQILLRKDTSLWVINTDYENAARIDKKAKYDYLPTGGQLYTYDGENKQLLDSQGLKTNLDLDSRINQIERSDSKSMGILCQDSSMYFLNEGNQLIELGKANRIVGFVQDTLAFISEDSLLYFYHPTLKESRFVDYARYALISSDLKGNDLLGYSMNIRRLFKFTLYDGHGKKEYSAIAKPINTIRDIYGEDFTKDILIGSYNGLIYSSFSTYIEKHNYDSSLSASSFGQVIWWIIERASTGEIYYAKEGSGAFRYRDGKSKRIYPYRNSKKEFKSNFFAHYHEASDRVYAYSFSSRSTIVHIWDFENDPIDIEIPGRYYCLTPRGDRYLLFGGQLGNKANAIIFDTELLKIVDEKKVSGVGLRIYDCKKHEDYDYLATNEGLFKLSSEYQEQEIDTMTVDTIAQGPMLAMLSDDQHLILGTNGSGLLIYHQDTLYKDISTSIGLVGNTVHSLQKDEEGRIWVGTLSGMSILNTEYDIIKNIRQEDGLGSSELNTKSLLCTGNKTIAGSINGLNIIDHEIIDRVEAYPAIIDQVSTIDEDGQTNIKNLIRNKAIELELGADSLTLHLHTYQLHRAYFDNDYLFKNRFVSALADPHLVKDNKIPISLKKHSLEIEHTLPLADGQYCNKIVIEKESFLERYGLVALAIFLILLLLSMLYLLNKKRIKDQQEEKVKSLNTSLDAMRASALRAQMNPHFIFNALGSIQYYIQRQETELAEEYLSDFSVLMRSTLDSSKEDFTKISNELEMLSLYMKLEHLRFEDKFEYEITIDEELDQTVEIPSMIMQPFIENAINHGVYHLTDRKGYISVNISESDDEKIICKIEDNGVGRTKAKEYRKKRHKSRAMSNIRERIEIMNAMTENNLELSVEDKIIDNEVQGTIVIISFGA